MSEKTRVGVVGVGSMGRHHARVHNELPDVELVGVSDVDDDRATAVAEEFETRPLARDRLLGAAEAVSIAVPTRHHAAVAREAIDAGTHVLVEKPFVADPDVGRDLIEVADGTDVVLQVGHVERYNPAVTALDDVLADVEPLAVETRRQGPPVDRDSRDTVIFDLMIHDIDLVLAIADSQVEDVSATGVPERDHVVAQLEFADGLVATLTSSRITQRRIREFAITADGCQIEGDYVDQSVQIHRHSLPEYIASDGDVRFRHESVIERPTVETGEPLKNELGAFVTAIREGEEPRTTGRGGLRAVEVARQIEATVDPAREATRPMTQR